MARHGHTSGKRSPTYITWISMKARCLYKKHIAYPAYGGAGVTVDPAWLTFSNFLADMGERPAGHTLDRRENTLGYSKANCRWATPTEQAANRTTKPKPESDVCAHGHPLKGDNLIVRASGRRDCRICHYASARKRYATKKGISIVQA